MIRLAIFSMLFLYIIPASSNSIVILPQKQKLSSVPFVFKAIIEHRFAERFARDTQGLASELSGDTKESISSQDIKTISKCFVDQTMKFVSGLGEKSQTFAFPPVQIYAVPILHSILLFKEVSLFVEKHNNYRSSANIIKELKKNLHPDFVANLNIENALNFVNTHINARNGREHLAMILTLNPFSIFWQGMYHTHYTREYLRQSDPHDDNATLKSEIDHQSNDRIPLSLFAMNYIFQGELQRTIFDRLVDSSSNLKNKPSFSLALNLNRKYFGMINESMKCVVKSAKQKIIDLEDHTNFVLSKEDFLNFYGDID